MTADETSVEILMVFEAALAGLVESGEAAGVESADDSEAAERALEYFFAGFVSAEFFAWAGFVGWAVVPLVVFSDCEALVADLFLLGFLVVEEAGAAEPSVAVPVFDGDPTPPAEGPEADVPVAPDAEPAVEPDDVDDDDESDPPPVVSVAQTGADATADPTPRAIASAPTRPTYRAYPMKDPPCRCRLCLAAANCNSTDQDWAQRNANSGTSVIRRG